MLAIDAGDETVGYLWFTGVAYSDEPIVELHVCVAPAWRGKWLCASVLGKALMYARSTGARYVLAIHSEEKLRSCLSRLGFLCSGSTINILDLKE